MKLDFCSVYQYSRHCAMIVLYCHFRLTFSFLASSLLANFSFKEKYKSRKSLLLSLELEILDCVKMTQGV